MYQLDWIQRLRALDKASAATAAPCENSVWNVSANVRRLGFTSLFTDISSEMVASILPLYFISYLHFSPLQFGILDGIYQGAAVALLSLFAGLVADRWGRQKEVATLGYALSAISRLILLLANGSWALAAGTLGMDRIGKGIRTAPRDALISMSSKPETLATSFAVHRGLDAAGAVLGPLSAFFVLRVAPGNFELVLVASSCMAIIGLGLIWLLVEKPVVMSATPAVAVSLRRSLSLYRQPSFRALLICSGMLSLTTVSDGFLYLALQQRTGSATTMFPLFAFLTAGFYLLFSLPAGRLADRWGRGKVFLAGNALLLLIYTLLWMPGLGTRLPFAILGLLGAYYAATDGVMNAMGSALLKPELCASGLAMLNTTVSTSRFLSSFLFGLLWTAGVGHAPIAIFLVGLVATLCISGWILIGGRN